MHKPQTLNHCKFGCRQKFCESLLALFVPQLFLLQNCIFSVLSLSTSSAKYMFTSQLNTYIRKVK